MTEIESILREAREWMDRAVGESWAVHDMMNPVLFDRIDAALAALREQGEAVLPPQQVNAILLSEYVRDRHGIERDCRIVEVAYAQGYRAAIRAAEGGKQP